MMFKSRHPGLRGANEAPPSSSRRGFLEDHRGKAGIVDPRLNFSISPAALRCDISAWPWEALQSQHLIPICGAQYCTAQRRVPMIASIERVLNALFAPLARELNRMPPSAFRYLVGGL
jgi:hypothetical protein